MNNLWNTKVISDIVSQHISMINPQLVFTFDEYGVSKHPNHVATYHGVRYYFTNALNSNKNNIYGFKLISNNLFRKFIGIFDLIILTLFFNELVILNVFGLRKAYNGNNMYKFIFYINSKFSGHK